MTWHDLKKYNGHLMFLLAAVALIALAMLHVIPIADIDIWWHLATGRHIVETGAFLSTDPFGLAGSEISPGRELILNGYWLSQVVFYGFHQVFGLGGIVALRVFLLLVPPLVVLIYGWRRFSFSAPVMILSLLCGWAMIAISGIRPNHLTVAIVPLFCIALADIGYVAERKGKAVFSLRKAYLLPLIMLVWANLHGGFLLGIAMLVLYVASETVTLKWYKQAMQPIAKLWGIAVVTVVASLLTPNGILPYTQYLRFQGGVIQQKTSEYLSPWVLAQKGTLVYWPYFILLFLCVLLIVVNWKRIPVTRVLLLLALAILSLTAFRYAPLFVGAATVLLISDLESLVKEIRKGRLLLNLASVVLVCFLVVNAVIMFPHRGGALSRGMVDASKFPTGAVDFLDQKGLTGTTFNHFNWGGYLAWRQPGKLTTFVDGRSLNIPLFHAYTRVLWLPEEAQSILDQNGVDLIVVPRLNPFTGELYALTDLLWISNRWGLVFSDSAGMVFVRQGRYQDVRRLNKSQIYRDVLADVERIAPSLSGTRNFDKIAAFARRRLNMNP